MCINVRLGKGIISEKEQGSCQSKEADKNFLSQQMLYRHEPVTKKLEHAAHNTYYPSIISPLC